MRGTTFAGYLAKKRSAYTREWRLLQHLRNDTAFRNAASKSDLENYLNCGQVPFGVRRIALAAWQSYTRERRRTLA